MTDDYAFGEHYAAGSSPDSTPASLDGILDGLNDRQLESVTAPVGNYLVVAGAGSGKTRLLVHRMAWLIANGIASPSNILAVTFTNKAAAEMRGRTESLVGFSSRAMWVGTFHGIAHRLLRIHHEEAELPANFEILDAADQERLVKRVLNDLNINDKMYSPKDITTYINRQKDEFRRSHEIEPHRRNANTDIYLRVYTEYERICTISGLVDFGELLMRSHELWLNKPDVLDYYRNRFQHILIDELQDTNTIQYAWLRMLVGSTGHVMGVGDDDQSIYGWRGARVANFRNFERDFSNTQIIRMEQNYRSTSTILNAANALIAQNTRRVGKSLWTASKETIPIRIYPAYSESDESQFIAEVTHDWIDSNGADSASDIAVLYRTNAQSRELEQVFMNARIPYRIYGGLRFYDRMEIRNALGYMRLICNRNSDTAFERIVNVPPRGIGHRTLEIVREIALHKGIPLWQAVVNGLSDAAFTQRSGTALAGFIDKVEEFTRLAKGQPLVSIAQLCVYESGLWAYHTEENSERAQARGENLNELLNACRQFQSGRVPKPANPSGASGFDELERFVDQAVLDSGEYQSEVGPCVNLMTLHSAKGLEFPLVFIVGMEEGLFPISRTISAGSSHELEEERRLAYVGITRCMKMLYLTYAMERMRFGKKHERTAPSRFIDEIPEEFVRYVRVRNTFPKSASSSRSLGSRDTFGNTERNCAYRIGQRVRHSVLGEGVILEIRGLRSFQLHINFKTAGRKWFVADTSQLQPLD